MLDGFPPADIHIDPEQAVKEPVTIVLAHGGTVQGHVFQKGLPLSGASVDVMVEVSEGERTGRSAFTAADGSFRISEIHVSPAVIQVRPVRAPRATAFDDANELATKRAEIVAGQTTTVDIEIPGT